MAVAFPIGIGLALVVGALSSYIITPHGNPLFLFGGICLVVIAIVCDSLAYRARETGRRGERFDERHCDQLPLCGLLMGSFYPLVSKAMAVRSILGPMQLHSSFVIGIALLLVAHQFPLYEGAHRQRTPRQFQWFYRSSFLLASRRNPRRCYLGDRSDPQLCSIHSPFRWTSYLILHRPRCHNDLCILGSLRLEGVSFAHSACPQSSYRHVCLFHRRSRFHRDRSHSFRDS